MLWYSCLQPTESTCSAHPNGIGRVSLRLVWHCPDPIYFPLSPCSWGSYCVCLSTVDARICEYFMSWDYSLLVWRGQEDLPMRESPCFVKKAKPVVCLCSFAGVLFFLVFLMKVVCTIASIEAWVYGSTCFWLESWPTLLLCNASVFGSNARARLSVLMRVDESGELCSFRMWMPSFHYPFVERPRLFSLAARITLAK